MNVPGDTPADELPGDELIDPQYRPVREFPVALAVARQILFGTDPDRHMLNYRVRQLLAVAHASPLEPFLPAPDARFTYRLSDPDLVGDDAFRPTVTKVAGGDVAADVFGRPEAPDATGRAGSRYLLEVLTPTTVRVGRLTAPIQNPVIEFEVGEAIPLAGSGYHFRFRAADTDQQWLVEAVNRPQRTLAELVGQLGRIGEPALDFLFGVGAAEPYKSFRNLWFSGVETPLRLAAFALALAYRTDERRLLGG